VNLHPSLDAVACQPRILIMASRVAPARELMAFARGVVRDGRAWPIVVFSSTAVAAATLREPAEGMDIIQPNSEAPGGTHGTSGRGEGAIRAMLRQFARLALPRELLAYIDTLQQLDRGSVMVSRLIAAYRPVAVVVADDRALGTDVGAVHAARRAGIPSLAVPFAVSESNADAAYRGTKPWFDAKSWRNRVLWQRLLKRHPEQVGEFNGRQLIFLTPGQILALSRRGISFSAPWSYGGGPTDRICVFNKADVARFRAAGVPEDKMIVSGQASLDTLHARRQDHRQTADGLRQRYVLGDESIVIIALPQHAEHGLMERGHHETETRQLLSDLRTTGAAVLVSLHPRAHHGDYRKIIEACGAHLLDEPLLDVIAAADLFVATHSSTLRWAILCRIPTVVLDDMALAAHAFGSGSGLVLLQARSEVREAAAALLEDSALRAETIVLLDRMAKDIDPFDGRNCARIVDAILTQSTSGKSRAA